MKISQDTELYEVMLPYTRESKRWIIGRSHYLHIAMV